MTRFLTLEQAQKRVGRSARTIGRWIDGGLRVQAGMIREDELLEADLLMRGRRGRPKVARTTKTTTLKSVAALTELLHDLNLRQHPTVAFVDAQGVTGVAYLTEGGGEPQAVFLTDPIDNRMRGGSHDEPGDESYIGYFEDDPDAELTAPITAIYHEEGRA